VNAFVGSYDTSTDEVRFRTEPVLNGQILDSDGEFISLSKLAKDPWATDIAVEDEVDSPLLREEVTGILMRRFESTREGSARAVSRYEKRGLKTAADFLNRPTKVITLRDLQRSTWDSEKAKDVHISFFREHKAAPEFDEGGNVIQLAKKASEGDWRKQFATIGQLETGGVKMLVEGFLPEGITMLGALSGIGKTWLGLSLAKALTTGTPFLGRFEVKTKVPVLYLIPESNGAAFRQRAEKFHIPDDPNLFLCRTVSQGSTLLMDDPSVKAAVAALKPFVILDTAIRFNKSEDENSSSNNKMLVDDSIGLLAAGARGLLGMHHATKASANEGLTLQNALRGTGDLGAMCDAVYGLKRNETLYDDGNGPLQLQVICLKPRDFEPPAPFTIAATTKSDDGQTISYIDTTGDFSLIDVTEIMSDLSARFVKAVTEDPTLSQGELAELLGIKRRKVQTVADRLHYKKRKGKWAPRTIIDTSSKTTEVDL
jgi:AAA domain